MPDLTVTGGAVSGPAAFAMAGIKPDDVDLLMGYDSFTITALLHLEDLGLLRQGRGRRVRRGRQARARAASLPMNTNGGGLSYTHPGHVRDVPAGRGGAPAPGRGGRPPGRRRTTWPWPTARAACCRRWARSCSARRRRCDRDDVAEGVRAAGRPRRARRSGTPPASSAWCCRGAPPRDAPMWYPREVDPAAPGAPDRVAGGQRRRNRLRRQRPPPGRTRARRGRRPVRGGARSSWPRASG